MRPQVIHAVHAGVGNRRVVQALNHLIRGERSKHIQDDVLQVQSVLIAQAVGVEARVASQFGHQQHNFTKPQPFTFVLQAQHHAHTIACQKRAIRIDGGVRCTRAWRRTGMVHGVVHGKAHPFGQRFQHGDIDVRTFTCFVALHQRTQDVGVGIHPCCNVSDRVATFAGCVRGTCDRQVTGLALNQQVVGFFVSVRVLRCRSPRCHTQSTEDAAGARRMSI
jgi:hypothetical protein